jgi:DNA-directed RNA polymerase subunit E'/Rpb7
MTYEVAGMATKVRMTLFKPVYLDQRVSVSPTELREAAADIDKFLVDKIRGGLEGQCCTHGYVRPGSTQILARSMGQAEHCRFTGDFLFHCKVKVMCLLPEAGQIVDAQILKMNKLGAYALVVDEGHVREAMRILLPRDLHLGNAEFDGLSEGTIIRVRLLRSRFQAKDPFIQAVGAYEGVSATQLQQAKKTAPGTAEEETNEVEEQVAASIVAP